MPSEREMNFKRFTTQSEASFHVNNIKDNNFASNSRFPEVILSVLFTINIKDILNNINCTNTVNLLMTWMFIKVQLELTKNIEYRYKCSCHSYDTYCEKMRMLLGF